MAVDSCIAISLHDKNNIENGKLKTILLLDKSLQLELSVLEKNCLSDDFAETKMLITQVPVRTCPIIEARCAYKIIFGICKGHARAWPMFSTNQKLMPSYRR